jgi:glycosyltransferase involved in cell wall biosynthesis
MKSNKIAIVTPLRNEKDNIKKLVDSIKSQSISIHYWLIIENDSDDGSIEMLNDLKASNINVDHLEIINQKSDGSKYELGVKYSSIIDTGFKHFKDKGILDELDFIGILDADCFPEPQYYELLTKSMSENEKIGISSGLIYFEDGTKDIASSDWVRGGCRLWKIECFLDSGYIIAPSADTISACKAMLNGWLVEPVSSLKVISRQLGSRVNYKYYGYSWYFRGHTSFFAVLVATKLILIGEFRKSREFVIGFFGSLFKGNARIEDDAIITYYRSHLSRKIFKLFKR